MNRQKLNKTLVWSRESVTIEQFLQQYRNKLPVIVKISEANKEAGHWKSLNAIYRVHKCEKQPRILTRDVDGRLLSLPIQTTDKFFYIPQRGSKAKNPDQRSRPLPHILFNEILPYSVVQDAEVSLAFHTDADIVYGAKLGVLSVQKSYAEDMLMGNIITGGQLFPAVMVIPALLNLRFHVVIGLADGEEAEWKGMQQQYDSLADKINYSNTQNDVYLKPPDILIPKEEPPPVPKEQIKPPEPQTSASPPVAAAAATSTGTPEADPASVVAKQRGRNRIFLHNMCSIVSAVSVIGDTDSGIEDIEAKYVEKLRQESLKNKQPPATLKEDRSKTERGKKTDSGFKELIEVPKDLSGLSVLDITDCLCLLHLADLAPSFVHKQIDGALLKNNFEVIKKDLHIAEVDAIKLEKFVKDEWRPRLLAPKSTYRISIADETRL